MFVPIIQCALAGILLGSWTIFMRKSEPYQFENFFITFITLLSFLFILYCLVVTGLDDFVRQLRATSPSVRTWLVVGGIGWGIGQILFGYGINMLGMALGYAIMLGVSMVIGTFITMFLMGGIPPAAPKIVYIYASVGVIVSLLGIILSSWAGQMKSSKLAIKNFSAGLIVCVGSGTLGSLFALSYAAVTKKGEGFLPTWSAMAVIVFIYWLVQVVFLIVRIFQHKTWYLFSYDSRKYVLMPLLSALFFSLALVFNFMATDTVGISLSYPMMMGIQILAGNIWAVVLFKEWLHAPRRAVNMQYGGLFLLLIAALVIGKAMGYIS
ncbi:MAG: L-rhamnose/proton symporter RhaT [bacterium]